MAPWGALDHYVDGSAVVHRSRPETVAAVRRILGPEPGPGPDPTAPIVTRPSGKLPEGTLVTEDGTELAVGGRPRDPHPLGYHRLVGRDGSTRSVIVSPGRCATGRSRWGWAVQLYAAHSATSWGVGDLGDLRDLGRWARSGGADYLMINPLGATGGGSPEPSPYYPATRRFLSPLYIRVDEVPLADRAGSSLDEARRAGTALNNTAPNSAALNSRALNDDALIDRDASWRLKRSALEAIWRSGPPPEAFERWLTGAPPSLHRFAVWATIADHHGPQFPTWPPSLRHPEAQAVAEFARCHDDEVRFHAWLQWVAGRQLEAATAEIGVLPDMAVGFDPTGFDAWEWQDLLALEVSIGAPPDGFNRQGQQWNLPPFVPSRLRAADYHPFVETLDALMTGASGLRVDHILGLFRLWWIPGGNAPDDGCYVRYPADELLAVLALESHRHGVPIVGEDLGTVEDGVREALAAHDVMSYRVLWFEDDAPSTWPEATAAAISTHDLPTTAGVWTGADLTDQRAAGQPVDAASLDWFQQRLCQVAGLDGDESVDEAVVAAHSALAEAPSRLRTATLEDAVGQPHRPNLPGSTVETNWSRPLPTSVEELDGHPLASRIAAAMSSPPSGRVSRPI